MPAGRSPTEYYSPQDVQAVVAQASTAAAASPAAVLADRLKPPPAEEKLQLFDLKPRPPLNRSLAKAFDEEFLLWKQGRSTSLYPWAKPGFSPQLLKELEDAGEEAADHWNKTGERPSPSHPDALVSHADQLALRQQMRQEGRGRGRGRGGRGGRGRVPSNNSSGSGDDLPVETPPHAEAPVAMETPPAAPVMKAPKRKACMKRPAAKMTEDLRESKQPRKVVAEAQAKPAKPVDEPVVEPLAASAEPRAEPSEAQRGPTKEQRADLREPFGLHI